MSVKEYKRSVFQRILGRPQTGGPHDPGCWSYENGQLTIDLSRAPELGERWGAISIEDERVPTPVLVFRDGDDVIRAFCNVCAHGGRRLDPVPDKDVLTCCSLGRSTYDLDGKLISGAAEGNILPFEIARSGNRLIIALN